MFHIDLDILEVGNFFCSVILISASVVFIHSHFVEVFIVSLKSVDLLLNIQAFRLVAAIITIICESVLSICMYIFDRGRMFHGNISYFSVHKVVLKRYVRNNPGDTAPPHPFM